MFLVFFVCQNNSNPGQDLSRCPPGLLALDTMAYFASRYPDAYSRVSEPTWLFCYIMLTKSFWCQYTSLYQYALTHKSLSICLSLCWKTAAERTNTSVRLPAAASSSRSSCVRSCASENPVSELTHHWRWWQ